MVGIYVFIIKTKNKPSATVRLNVLALNTWYEASVVNGGFDALVNVILETKANIVLLCEIYNQDDIIFSDRIVAELKKNGAKFYTFNSKKSPLILSKFPIESITQIKYSKSLTKCKVKINNKISIVLYGAHLDNTHYACYLPRGYDGITFKKLAAPILDIDKMFQQNMESTRPNSIDMFIYDSFKEKKDGNIVILGGDFNEPSHLDWTQEMKYKFQHNGTVINWNCSNKLSKCGFIDTYRYKYPNPVQYPGITWPAYNKDVEFEKLIWTPDADGRERIDFIYYYPDKRINIHNVVIVGPIGSIVKSQFTQTNPGCDKFFVPKGIWPSDHKGILTTFILKL